MERPTRKYQLSISIGGDDFQYVISMLNQITVDIERHGDATYESYSGGYSGNNSVKLAINPDMTHDDYFAALEAYLAEKE